MNAAKPNADGDAPEGVLLPPPERVLATLEADGKRRWIRPRPSPGRFLTGRRVVAYALMAIFLLLPHLSVGGKPAILLDIMAREFTFFGTTFVATDTPILLVFMLGILLSVFLATALLGRVWCGWACPQTVYLEFLFRPLDRLFEGSYQQQAKLDREGGGPRRVAKNVTFVLISAFLAHTFLAYFVGWSRLIDYVTGSPFAHPTAFLVVIGVTAAMSFDFIWFREQTCLVACPYGRFQSVLLDRDSLIVGYDVNRGEPRGKPRKKLPVAEGQKSLGDCIDCKACVTTCPTGIDIRDGLQLECIGCAQCIDACDTIMAKLGREPGLVRYGSRAELEEAGARRVIRPRVVIYGLALLLVSGLFVGLVSGRESAKVTALRGLGKPFAILPSGEVSNQIRLKVRNQGEADQRYTLTLVTPSGAELIAPENPLPVAAGEIKEATVFVVLPPEVFAGSGEVPAELEVSDGGEFSKRVRVTLLGPK